MRSPSSSPSVRRFEVDWVIVSVAGIKRWGLLAFALLLAGGVVAGVFYFTHEPPEVKAQRLLLRATAAQEQVRRAGFSDNLAAEFDQASRLLEEARSDWERKDYPACVARAEDALQRFELLGGLANRDFVGSGQVIALQGKVKVGQVNVFTAANPSSVVTDAARADVERDSRVGVEVAEDSGTLVSAYAGRAKVTGATGGQVELRTRQAVSAAPGPHRR